jgi:hypothetical protein
MDSRELARLALQCMSLRQESYDHAAANAQEVINDAERAAPGAGPYAGMGTDWARFYRKTVHEACKEACVACPEMVDLMSAMLAGIWNETEQWACELLAA